MALFIAAAMGLGQSPAQPAAGVAASAGIQSPSQAAIHGRITDPSGALIPGTQITISNLKGQTIATAIADTAGNYEVRNLAPGSYTVTAISDGFAPFASQALTVNAGQVKRVDVAMAIETAQQNVVVTDESPSINVEADANGNSMVIKGKDLEALSDDPDELSNELSALAGPSAGPNGGQIYIDGFTGGQLPPKSSIREIRVNQNPYSAEYDRLGFGRIEILTKPGTDKLHGQFMIQGNDSTFNTGTPFAKTTVPPYYSYQYNGTLNGSIGKKASFFISAEHRTTNNEIIYNTSCDALGNCSDAGFSGSLSNPHGRTNVSPRLDVQLGAKNTLTVRYQFYRDSETGDLNSTQLPSQSNDGTTTDHNVQISDTQIINDRIVNETRFQYDRSISSTTPKSNAPTLVVSGDFSGGGSSEQQSHEHNDRLEFQNLTTMSLGKHALKFGTRLRDSRDANGADAGFNGTFTFADKSHYGLAVQDAIKGVDNEGAAAKASQLSYSTGAQSALANVFDAALFVQDDWKFSPRLTLSGGLRWETQNHVGDHSDFAPRVSMAWAVDGSNGKQAKTVLRAGYGIFYDRMGINNFLTINRASIQSQYTIANPTAACFNASFTQFDASSCGTGSSAARTAYQVAGNYRSPYTQQFGASIERQITKAQTATLTSLHSTGVHQMVQINANAPYLTNYDNTRGNVYQYTPEGVFKQDQLILNTNVKFSQSFNVFGFYTLSFAHTDGAGGGAVSDSSNIGKDYGRAGFVSRNSLFLIGNYSAPWGIRLNPFLIAQSGKPFNITTGTDLNGDSFFNDRPGLATSADCSSGSSQYVSTSYGCLDTNPVAGEKLIAYNAGNGPSAVAVNLRISRAFGIGPKLAKIDPNANQGGGPPGGGPPGGGRGPGGPGGGPGGGFGPGGFGGGGRGGPGGMFGPTNTGRKYNLNFSVQALNLFNNHDYGQPIGTVGSSRFGHSTGLAGMIFSQGSAVRRIFLQANFSF